MAASQAMIQVLMNFGMWNGALSTKGSIRRNAQRLPDSSSEEYIVPRVSAESQQSRKTPLKIEVTTMYELNNSRESQVSDQGIVLPSTEGAARPQGTGWRHTQSETRIVGGAKSDSRRSKHYQN